jgi:hypothetical protein
VRIDARSWVALGLMAVLSACHADKSGSDSSNGDADTDSDADSDADTDADTDVDSGTPPATFTGDCTKICALYGGSIQGISVDITEGAGADPEFAPFFAPIFAAHQQTAFEMSLAAFICDTYRCSTALYTGPDMVTAHTGMNITQAQYDDFLALIAKALLSNGVDRAAVDQCFAPALTDPTFEASIIGH